MDDSFEAPEGFLAAMLAVVGPEHCLRDHDLKAGYEVDWTRRFGGPALLVVRPADTDEVAAVLAACSRFGVPVVPQGGNTGLVGGSVPRRGEVVLSLRRLDRVLRCDADEGLLVAGAGTTLGAAQSAAAGVDSELGIDIAARDSATLGGMVATNAGGIHVVRYGPMRARLAGIEVVLADGTVASRLSGLREGQRRLRPLPDHGRQRRHARRRNEGRPPPRARPPLPRRRPGRLCGQARTAPSGQDGRIRAVSSVAVALASGLRRRVDGIEALELVYADGMALVREALGLPAPPDPGADAWLLVEASGGQDPTGVLGSRPRGRSGRQRRSPSPKTAAGRARLWAYRDRHTEAIATLGVPHKLDVTLPMTALAEFAGAVRSGVAAALGHDRPEHSNRLVRPHR